MRALVQHPRLVLRLGALASGLVAAALVRATVLAQESEDSSTVGSGVSTFGVGDWFGLGVRLALVVAIIWVAVAGMRWWVRRMNHGARGGRLGALEVLETHALGPNRTLHLVRLGDRAVLVGATPERITQLLTVDDPEELRRLSEVPEEEPRPAVAGARSVLSSLGTGLLAMNVRRREADARLRAQRAAAKAARPGEPGRAPRASRFAGLRDVLGRSRANAPRRTVAPAVPSREEARQSLFERTLASIEAVEVQESSPAPTAAGLRARAGYGQATGVAVQRSGDSREQQIAELQRAIEAARRNAG